MRSLVLAFVLSFPALSLAADFVPISHFDLGPAAGIQRHPAVAEGPDGFLATWVDNRNSFAGTLRATRIDEQGNVIDPAGIVIANANIDDSSSITSQHAFWSGSDWLVLFLQRDTLRFARLSAEGKIVQSPLTISAGANSPKDTFEAIVTGERIIVTGPAANGASLIALDFSGSVMTGPTIIEKSSPQRQIRSVLPAPLGNYLLVVDIAAYACTSCPTLVAHKLTLGGVELARTTPTGIDNVPRVYQMAPVGNGFLIVGQDYGARVESWLLSSGLTTIDGHEVISSTAKLGFTGSLLVRTSLQHKDLLYFAPNVAQGPPSLHLAEIAGDGKATNVPFDIADANDGELDLAVTSAGAVAVMTQQLSEDDTDVVTRFSPSVDSLPQATSRALTFSAPVQNKIRALKKGAETFVSWVEEQHGQSASDLLVTRLDSLSKPIPALPVRLMDGSTPYAIASDGTDYLVARSLDSAISVRRLGADLAWRDASWTTLVPDACGDLNEHSLVWDGVGWWLGWVDCGLNAQVELRRFNRSLQPMSPVVTLQGDEPQMPLLARVDGAIIAFWVGGQSYCPVLCPPGLGKLRGARVSTTGSILTSPVEILDDIQLEFFDFASRGSELLAIWTSAGNLYGTRITRELVPLDVIDDGTALRGSLLEESGLDAIDIGWDGTDWVVAVQTIQYSRVLSRRMTYRRFAPGSDPASMWNSGAILDLGDPAAGFTLAVSSGAGGPTYVIEPLANDSTTGVFRYFSRNMTVSPRMRGVRR